MTSVELKLLQQIVEAKAEEKSYEQFDEEQILDGMNYCMKDVTAKLTSISILAEAQVYGKSTRKVPSVKFYCSAVVSTISTTNTLSRPSLSALLVCSISTLNFTSPIFMRRILAFTNPKVWISHQVVHDIWGTSWNRGLRNLQISQYALE